MAKAKTVAKKVEKKAAAKTISAVKAPAPVKTEEAPKSVEEVKSADAVKEAAKPVEADKAAAAEKPVKAAEEKAVKAAKPAKPAKAAAEKTTRAKAAKASSEKIVLQVNGRADLSMDSLVEKVKAAYAAEGHSVDSIKDIEVYIKLDENMAYYVIDGYASGTSLY